jgi:hypothetical protein
MMLKASDRKLHQGCPQLAIEISKKSGLSPFIWAADVGVPNTFHQDAGIWCYFSSSFNRLSLRRQYVACALGIWFPDGIVAFFPSFNENLFCAHDCKLSIKLLIILGIWAKMRVK